MRRSTPRSLSLVYVRAQCWNVTVNVKYRHITTNIAPVSCVVCNIQPCNVHLTHPVRYTVHFCIICHPSLYTVMRSMFAYVHVQYQTLLDTSKAPKRTHTRRHTCDEKLFDDSYAAHRTVSNCRKAKCAQSTP